jgi:hypothetical protein
MSRGARRDAARDVRRSLGTHGVARTGDDQRRSRDPPEILVDRRHGALPGAAYGVGESHGALAEPLCADRLADLGREEDLGREQLQLLPAVDERLDAVAFDLVGEREVRREPIGALAPARHARRGALQHEPPHELRMIQDEPHGDPRAHGVADDVRRRRAEMVEQRRQVACLEGEVVARGVAGASDAPWPSRSGAMTR